MKTLQKQNDCYSSDSCSDTESGSDSSNPPAAPPSTTSRSKKKEYEEIVEIPKRKYIRKKPIAEEDMKLKLVKARLAKANKQAGKPVKKDKPPKTIKPDKPEAKPQKETIINNYYYKQEEEEKPRRKQAEPKQQPEVKPVATQPPRRRIIASFI